MLQPCETGWQLEQQRAESSGFESQQQRADEHEQQSRFSFLPALFSLLDCPFDDDYGFHRSTGKSPPIDARFSPMWGQIIAGLGTFVSPRPFYLLSVLGCSFSKKRFHFVCTTIIP